MLTRSFGNPKTHIHRTNTWYNYYADFSSRFVEEVLTYLAIPETALVLDPWNGSGTTTQVAEDRGLLAFGFDINPAMVIVARARRLDPDSSINLPGLCNDIISKAVNYTHKSLPPLEYDPLHTWLSERSAQFVRDIERAIQALLLDQEYVPLCKLSNYDKINNLISTFYTALFQTVRHMIKPFQSSNPTWIKEPKTTGGAIDIELDVILQIFKKYVFDTIMMLDSRKLTRTNISNNARIDIASSTAIPMLDKEASVVISSPPYCTRIDYAVATKPELAILGYAKHDVGNLRDKIIGTTTIYNKNIIANPTWGEACNSFLHSVYSHGSKASNTYYYRNFLQYFDSIYRSLQEIDRVLSSDGFCSLVVQDSHYKDVHNDLPQIFIDFAESLNWKLCFRENFPIGQTMAGINRQTKRYRSSASAVESILIFHK